MHMMLPVAVAVVIIMMSAALGVARAQGVWLTAQLSEGRYSPAAASVGNAALFAGGWSESGFWCRDLGGGEVAVFLFYLRECFVFCACCSIAILFALRPQPPLS
jgi:hypothetical protein